MLDSQQEVLNRETVKSGRRFLSEHVVKADGRHLFVKTAMGPESYGKIKQQVRGARYLSHLLKDSPWLRVENILKSDGKSLVAEWVPGGRIAEPKQFSAGENLGVIGEYVRVAAELDDLAIKNFKSSSYMKTRLGRHRATDYKAHVEEKFTKLWSKHNWDRQDIERALTYFDERVGTLHSTWQHGDLTPYHILRDGKHLVLVDCEHVSNAWPRFYDIANFYSHLQVRYGLDDSADEMLDMFKELRSEDPRDSEAFWAVAAIRTVNRIAEHQDKPEMVQRAFGLLEKIAKT